MDEALEKQKYRKILNLLNQINQDLIFYDRELPLLKETLNQYVQVNNQFYGKEIYKEVEENIEDCIQSLNNVIPSLVNKLN